MRSKLRSLEARAVTVETKMKEISLVNRAKWLLIDRLKMSEEEAHRYIEKSAMDDCVSKSVIAQGIIKTYDS
jgi:response regulator NasT